MKRSIQVLAGVLVLTWLVSPVRAEEKPDLRKAPKFTRFVPDDAGGGKLQTAIVSYENEKGVRVTLVSAVHVGDRAYYEDLNRRFEKFDAVLYELIKPREAAAPKPGERGGGGGLIGGMQRLMQDELALDYQLDRIDYSRKNFVHADLDAETFEKMQADRGESMLSLMLRQIIHEMAARNREQPAATMDPFELLDALLSEDRARKLKLLVARSFDDVDRQMSALEGTVLMTERNKAAVRAMKAAIADGKKNLAIFYGAGHMADLDERLVEMMDYRRTGIEWVTAWDIPAGR